ncbi:hypothetical protein FIBSPDRAFT_827839 [Athelia psychrophila]|uniref:Uncharacterized protein n=1 Tax=Athelia psychrophila TaxID=1759441 RepID=A0A166I995_9AGAM|nr:hypothetical protein FIBSPDRAFT_827839 [Fibularhizoctonia sp. CBS 109695]
MSDSATVSPTEQEVVDIIRRIQQSQGVQTGIPKIHEFIKASRPAWVLSEKRLRDIRRKHNLVPSDSTTSLTSGTHVFTGPMKKLHLKYILGGDGPTVPFLEDIPAELCDINAPREATSKFISDLIELRDVDALKRWDSTCLFCARRAQALYSIPGVTLHVEPPTVLVTALPLCSMTNACARKAGTLMENAMMDPNGPIMKEASVYTMS